MKKSAAERGRQRQNRERGNERKLETAKTCRSKTAVERHWKHCHSVAASACLDLSQLGL